MKDYKIIGDYIIQEEIGRDAFGINYKARKTVRGEPGGNKLAVELYDDIGRDPESIKALRQYLKEIRRSTVPKLLIPEDVIESKAQVLLIFPYIEGRTLKEVLDDSEKGGMVIDFHMTMLIVVKIAILIDIASMVLLNRKPSFHGFLIPENIIIDYKGDVYLKHYGMLPFVNSSIFARLKIDYRVWMTPELYTRGEILNQSEIYYLGHIVYRVLTGKFFPCPPGDDFEIQITNISFSHHIPSTDKSFIIHFMEFFRKTLNPDPGKRFADMEEFTGYISGYFFITNTPVLTADLSQFMKNLFQLDEATNPLEIGFGEEKKQAVINDDEEVIDASGSPAILEEKKKSSKKRYLLPVLVLVIMAGFVLLKVFQKPAQLPVKNEAEHGGTRSDQKIDSPVVKSAEQAAGKIDLQTSREDPGTQKGALKPIQKKEDAGETKEGTHPQKMPEKKESFQPRIKKNGAEGIEKPKEIYQLNEIDTKPRKVSGANPVLGAELAERYQGKVSTVLLNILINQSGSVEKVELLSQIPALLSDPLERCLLNWRFTPARKENREVKVWMPVSVNIAFQQPVKTETKVPPEEEKVKETGEAPLVLLSTVTRRPEKISGDDPVFSKAILGSYRGRRATIYTELLINEKGEVTRVRIKNKLPRDITNSLIQSLKDWKYSPARKDSQLVKVWFPVILKIHFK